MMTLYHDENLSYQVNILVLKYANFLIHSYVFLIVSHYNLLKDRIVKFYYEILNIEK